MKYHHKDSEHQYYTSKKKQEAEKNQLQQQWKLIEHYKLGRGFTTVRGRCLFVSLYKYTEQLGKNNFTYLIQCLKKSYILSSP